MHETFLKLYVKGQTLLTTLKEENGQDLVEYAAVICLVVLALAGGMKTLASGINEAMNGMGAKIGSTLNAT